MSVVRKPIQLNNQAISFLERMLYKDAILFSWAALEIFQRHQHEVDQVSLAQQDAESNIDQFLFDHEHKKSYHEGITDEFIYEHGIVLPTDTTMASNVISAILIFNCALSHQLAASHCNDDGRSRTYLERAKALYQLTFDIQDQDVKNTLFKFAVLNNIGVIHKRLGNYEESKHYFEHLVSLMMVLVDVGVENKGLHHIQSYWKNVLENGSIAPAA